MPLASHTRRATTALQECVLAGDVEKMAELLSEKKSPCDDARRQILSRHSDELFIKSYMLDCINQYSKIRPRALIITSSAVYHIILSQDGAGKVRRYKRFPASSITYVHYGFFSCDRSRFGVRLAIADERSGGLAKVYTPSATKDSDRCSEELIEEIAQVLNCVLRAAKGPEGVGLVNRSCLDKPSVPTGIARAVADTLSGRLIQKRIAGSPHSMSCD
ncbi:Inositol phosphatase [Carpediemonas membranifera]|uniref:Inositol phosphatase n=1 Tax=Carpediemonas membranifera TaxID=201153 RepID=A0A8J6AWY2_9EUKA|nr:Inositol phosphatase [Carpediemonas membranifera]|eukprot:KAG9396916.1 Inositol phosphatase [Carpediemonas membranifera]